MNRCGGTFKINWIKPNRLFEIVLTCRKAALWVHTINLHPTWSALSCYDKNINFNYNNSLCFALPNKDLNCFELVEIPCDGQRRNGEERPSEGAPASTERQNLLATEYVESLPMLNPDNISHPLLNHYHSQLSQMVNKPGLFIPVDPCRESSSSGHAGNLILSHG